MADFRALCAELANTLERTQNALMYEGGCSIVTNSKRFALVSRARAALAQPEAEGPTDNDLLGCMIEAVESVPGGQSTGIVDWERESIAAARAVLARWGHPAPQPIPVSERLPGEGDCAPWPDEPEADPWCWAAKDVDGGWEWTQLGICHFRSILGRVIGGLGYTHWLPHWALPLPEEGQ